jgi:hypothetical protein
MRFVDEHIVEARFRDGVNMATDCCSLFARSLQVDRAESGNDMR